MYAPHKNRRGRGGFTLVEVLVAAALSISIMYLLSWAFSQGLETMKRGRAIGELQERLRIAVKIMTRDLESPHFPAEWDGVHGPQLADQRLDRADWTPPERGFFRIVQNSALVSSRPSDTALPTTAYHLEGPDNIVNIPSLRATDHSLHFTVRLEGDRRGELFAAPVASLASQSPQAFRDGTNFYSQWAEVIYFLEDQGETTDPDDGSTPLPLFTLRRVERLLLPPSSTLAATSVAASERLKVSLNASNQPNKPGEVVIPANRFGGTAVGNYTAAMTGLSGSDKSSALLLPDVLSMEVRANWVGVAGVAASPVMTTQPFEDLPTTPNNTSMASQHVFDTWFGRDASGNLIDWGADTASANTVPMRVWVRSLQVRLRVYDRTLKTARQVTFTVRP